MRVLKPTTDDMIRALKACAADEPQVDYLCDDCYLYPLSLDGRMSTGRTCFEHLTLDVINALQKEDTP